MTELSVSLCQKSPQSERDHGTMISEIVIGSQEKSSLEAASFRKAVVRFSSRRNDLPRRNINSRLHGFPSLSETFLLVRALRQVSPDGDSFTPSGWPVTGPLAGPLRSVEGLHLPGIFNSNEKRILPSAAIRKHIHFGDWPVYCRISPTGRRAGSQLGGDTVMRHSSPNHGSCRNSAHQFRTTVIGASCVPRCVLMKTRNCCPSGRTS